MESYLYNIKEVIPMFKEYTEPFNEQKQCTNFEFNTKEDMKHYKYRSKMYKKELKKITTNIKYFLKNRDFKFFFDEFENLLNNAVSESVITETQKDELISEAINKLNFPSHLGIKTRSYLQNLKEKTKTKPRAAWKSLKDKFKQIDDKRGEFNE